MYLTLNALSYKFQCAGRLPALLPNLAVKSSVKSASELANFHKTNTNKVMMDIHKVQKRSIFIFFGVQFFMVAVPPALNEVIRNYL